MALSSTLFGVNRRLLAWRGADRLRRPVRLHAGGARAGAQRPRTDGRSPPVFSGAAGAH